MTARHISARGRHDVVRGLADPDRDFWADISGQAVMVLMGMRDHHAEQAVVGLPEPRNLRQQLFLPVVRRVERQADVERNALPLRLDLDAGAADLFRAPMNAQPQA